MTEKAGTYRAGTLTYTKAGLVMLFLWLLWGGFCFQFMENAVPNIVLLKFRALKVPNTLVGIIMGTIPGIFNLTLNPVISVKSDRCRNRWGRRIPFILVTLPFLVGSLVAVAFSSQIAVWLQTRFGVVHRELSPTTVALIVLATFVILFALFNTFVNSVFWYLFNDVVPEYLLARFISYFRLVSMIAASSFSLFFLKYADTYSGELLLAISILYAAGLGMMCLKVKEGEYPVLDEVEQRSGVFANIKTYTKECMGLAHYWYVFGIAMCMATFYAGCTFMLYYNLATGLSLDLIGKLAAITTATTVISIPLSGWLADKFHPIRVIIWGLALGILFVPLDLIWAFWHPASMTVFWVRAIITIVIGTVGIGFMPGGATIGALIQLVDPPLLMRIFPRERYGQFCSAASIFRSLSGIIAGVLLGAYLDLLTAHFGSRVANCLLPLWFLPGGGAMLYFMIKLYRTWKTYGGDAAYKPPLPDVQLQAQSGAAMAPDSPDTSPTPIEL